MRRQPPADPNSLRICGQWQACRTARPPASEIRDRLLDLNQLARGSRLRAGRDGLRSSPEIHVRSVVHASLCAPWSAGLLGHKLPTNIVHRVILQRLARITALLRAIMHQAVFADVEISSAGP